MSVWSLLKQVWFRMLHLESRSLRFLWRIFIPGQVSREFLAGKQKRYPPPVRFFFVVMFIFLFTLNHVMNTDGIRFSTQRSGVAVQQVDREKILSGKNFYEKMQQYAELKRMRREFDSLPDHYRTALVQQAVDSLLQRTYGEAAEDVREMWEEAPEQVGTSSPDSISINLGFRQIRIASLDVFELEPDQIIQVYHIESWIDKVMVRQGLKAFEDPQALLRAYLGSFAWTILALIGLMAAILKLLYWRQGRYYVEHFVFLLNEHTAMFSALTLAFLINYFFTLKWWFWVMLICWLLISPYLSMYRFYGQGKWMTFFKGSIFSVAYLIGFILLFSIGLLLVILLF